MKTRYLALFFIVVSCVVIAQEKASNFTAQSTGELQHPRNDLMNFVPNEVLIKFKDAATVNTGSRIKAAGINTVDDVLKTYGVTSLEKLFPTEQKPLRARSIKSPQGTSITLPRIDNIYRISIPTNDKTQVAPPTNIFQLIEELKALPEVEYAEPNYIYSIDNMQPVGDILTSEDVAKLQTSVQKSKKNVFTPNDPLYAQQWYIPAVKADSVWQQTTGDSTQVIAILDTGVDWNHPDLKNKIWTNPNPNSSPDANGVVNDIRGWDYINNDNNPMDDNSHGTHVAGIAAAETNNGIGIAGVNWKAKIMPLKVFQSSGRGDAATIAKGIIYASTHGATVINMSFGSYANSLAMEDALANAYATTILVAAAGNDGLALESCIPAGQFFPAALSFVLGVQSPEASFSNYDCNGPTFSNTSDLVNYEMKAPGTNIMSTIPNGNYRVYQGTSMAAPIVSGALSLYRKLIPYDTETNEFMWVKLIQATGQYLNINKALTINPKPEIWFLNKVMVDTIGNDDKDGRVDAGETIQLWFRARNTGGQVDSVYWKIRLAEFEDPTTCNIVKPTSFLGSISPYATRTSESDPMKFIISNNVVHDRDITFDLLSWYKGAADTIVQKFVFTAENGEQLSGVLEGVKILYPNRLYLVNNSFKVGTTGTLIIKPGAHILFYPEKTVPIAGRIIAEGTKDSLIMFEGYIPPNSYGGIGSIFDFRSSYHNRFNYCKFSNIGGFMFNNSYYSGPSVLNSIIDVGGVGIVDSLVNNNCHFIGNNGINTIYRHSIAIKNNFIGTSTTKDYYFNRGTSPVTYSGGFKYNNILNYSITEQEWTDSTQQNAWISEYSKPAQQWTGSFYKDVTQTYTKYTTYYQSSADFQKVQYQYWGTSDSAKIEGVITDFMEVSTYPRAVFKPFLNAPPEECHGLVWKVLVNGKDAQDEKVEPVGVGKQRFDVYFNRPMDITITPQVSFGVRYPFSSNAVNEEGAWSDDGRIFTVYKNIKLTTGDGFNRIRVTGAKDLEGWEIPTEDMRYSFLISAAGSSSLEFMANAGLGKVKLEWNNSDLEDGLGYNMYRMEHINDSTLTEPTLINSSLITDTLYTDFAVTPNKKYYYYYKVLRTNMSETDPSKVASAIPFTAAKGDANGDLNVNVLDITSIVAYLLNNNPQPFIFEAADLNSDGNINVLDIVGVVNKILNVPQGAPGIAMTKQVDLFLENDTLFANSNTPIGGIQLDIKGVSSTEDIHTLKALDGFESGNSIISDSLRLIFYSMSGKNIPAGERIPLLKLKSGSTILNAIFGETNGSPIKVNYILTRIPDIQSNMNQTIAELGQNYPNPVNGKTIIPIRIYEPVNEVILQVVNLMGQEVDVIHLENPYIGEHKLEWNPKQNKGLFIYTLKVMNGKQKNVCPAKQMIVQ